MKQPPEPKSRVSDQRTEKLFVAIPESGAPVQFWSTVVSQSVFFGVPENDVLV